MVELLDAKSTLLEPLETAVVPALKAPVLIRDHFNKNPGVRFSNIFAEFKNRFFDKTERPAAQAAYRKYKLLGLSDDGPIIAELGGGNRVEGTFGAAFALLRRQSKGEMGFLQTNGYSNIFYVRDKKGALCSVRIGWTRDGWEVDAIPIADPLAWIGNHVIICPDRLVDNEALQILDAASCS
jgi:hypothetical protein